MKTEITPLLIVIKLEQFDYVGAAAIGLVMLSVSFLMLFTINAINGWRLRRVSGRR
jgi:sulfate transport system permease protein